MPIPLDEISGLSFLQKDSTLLAINDERGDLWKINPAKPRELQRYPFSVGGDYEDLVVMPPTVYVLKSGGSITAFRFGSTADSVLGTEYPFPVQGGHEFESLYWEPRLGQLMLVCKDCERDKKDSLSIYAFNPATQRFSLSPYAINAEEIFTLQNKKPTRFKPSAAAIHPITGEVYLVSAVNKILVVTSRRGNVKNVYALDPAVFKQPEGIAFSPSGTMFISNEAADIGVANVLIFRYTPSR